MCFSVNNVGMSYEYPEYFGELENPEKVTCILHYIETALY